ncbi:class I adenylate-forming enzyme family protein [Micromonospora sp. DT233]|uniref:class I adenylate-forming enzyme family protein n=1 Tax=Micromonospora sp. DT233 TaxID=3393432 RepID=UPI003CF8E799
MTTEPGPYDLAHTFQGRPLGRPLELPATLLACLAQRLASAPDDPYLTTVAADGATETLTYRRLDALSAACAHWLRSEAGVTPGQPVGLLPVNDVASVVTIFALMRTGCPVLFLNPGDPVPRIRSQVDALGVRVVLRGPGAAGTAYADATVVPAPGALPEPGPIPPPVSEPGADAFYFGTSGTTATSKMVAQTHYAAAVNAEAVRRHHRLRPGDRLLGCLPIHHVNGVHFTLLATLAAGAHAILVHGFDPFGYPKLIERMRPRIASVVPSILESLAHTWRRPVVPAEFDYFVSAAAPLQASTARAVAERLGVRVMQGYGLTETINFSATMPPDVSAETYRRLMLEAEIPSIGVALYGNEVAVLAADGRPAALGEVGEICMRGHNVMSRYVDNVAATDEAFRDGWFHSQDLGFLTGDEDSPHRFVVITGRSKNIAKVRGESVSLDEMDRALRVIPTMVDAACVALPHRTLGDEIVAGVVCPDQVSDDEIHRQLGRTFPPSALPSRVVRLAAVPRTPTGKVVRLELARVLAQDATRPPTG